MKADEVHEVYKSFLNGQGRQAVEQIDAYGLYDFWADYAKWLADTYGGEYTDGGRLPGQASDRFVEAVITYHRIKHR